MECFSRQEIASSCIYYIRPHIKMTLIRGKSLFFTCYIFAFIGTQGPVFYLSLYPYYRAQRATWAIGWVSAVRVFLNIEKYTSTYKNKACVTHTPLLIGYLRDFSESDVAFIYIDFALLRIFFVLFTYFFAQICEICARRSYCGLLWSCFNSNMDNEVYFSLILLKVDQVCISL